VDAVLLEVELVGAAQVIDEDVGVDEEVSRVARRRSGIGSTFERRCEGGLWVGQIAR